MPLPYKNLLKAIHAGMHDLSLHHLASLEGPKNPLQQDLLGAILKALPEWAAYMLDEDTLEQKTERGAEGLAAAANAALARATAAEAALAADKRGPHERSGWFPLQNEERTPKYDKPQRVRIPWAVAEKAYGNYAARYGRDQSLERLAERGGFGQREMDAFHPTWREEADEITRLAAALAETRAEVERLRAERAP